MAGSAVAADVVYVDDPFLMILIIAFVFVFIALTENRWFIGIGLFAVLTSTLFVFVMWASLADYPLTYRDGDHPHDETQGTGLYETWDLRSGESVSTTFDVIDASDVESLSGDLRLDYGCPEAQVYWLVYADDDLIESGTLREGQELDLTDVAVESRHTPAAVTLTAERVDTADCKTALIWGNPGFEGPGNGEFHVVFPLPGD